MRLQERAGLPVLQRFPLPRLDESASCHFRCLFDYKGGMSVGVTFAAALPPSHPLKILPPCLSLQD